MAGMAVRPISATMDGVIYMGKMTGMARAGRRISAAVVEAEMKAH